MMPFHDQGYFMHNNCLDVAIHVLKVQFEQPGKYVKMKIDYYNLGYDGKPWIIERNNNFVVNVDQYHNWVKLTPEQWNKPRTKSGLPS